MLSGRRVILGVSGGIACYKSCTLARRLTEVGAKVDVIMTSSAERFVGSVTFEALTQRPVFTSLWKPGAALAHVTLAQEADVVVVAPATANLIAKANQGLADDFLTSLLLANEKPVILAPAMNDAMYAHPATQQNLSSLKSRGWVVVGPEVGPLAEGPSDKPGRMTEPESIIPWIAREIGKAGSRLSGRKVVVTAGPTREDIDPVRLITNRSSGKMGYAIAEQVFQRGAEVVLVTGPTALAAPVGVKTVSVENTAEMEHAVSENLEGADALIMAAAPADYRVDSPAAEKRPRSKGELNLQLAPTDDILIKTKSQRGKNIKVVGFALETDDGLAHAREKLDKKDLDLIVLNMANEEGAGFESNTNRVTLVWPDKEEELSLMSKTDVADRILDALEKMI